MNNFLGWESLISFSQTSSAHVMAIATLVVLNHQISEFLIQDIEGGVA